MPSSTPIAAPQSGPLRRLARAVTIAALVTLAGAAAAQERRMLDADEAVPFRGVGRLNVAGARFCTATLVAPDEALTAAHCLFHPRTRAPVPASELRFVAGLRLGETAAVRRVAEAAVHPDFRFDGAADLAGVQADLALLRLARPVPADAATPIGPGGFAPDGGPLTIVSYARDRAQAPSIEAPCGVVATFGAGAALDCTVNFGASGAPVLQGEGAGVHLVGVVSAMGLADGRDVTLVALAEPALARLRALLDAEPPVSRGLKPAEALPN